jgi:hypothetical protein
MEESQLGCPREVVKTGILNDIKHRDSMKCEGQHPEQTF